MQLISCFVMIVMWYITRCYVMDCHVMSCSISISSHFLYLLFHELFCAVVYLNPWQLSLSAAQTAAMVAELFKDHNPADAEACWLIWNWGSHGPFLTYFVLGGHVLCLWKAPWDNLYVIKWHYANKAELKWNCRSTAPWCTEGNSPESEPPLYRFLSLLGTALFAVF